MDTVYDLAALLQRIRIIVVVVKVIWGFHLCNRFDEILKNKKCKTGLVSFVSH